MWQALGSGGLLVLPAMWQGVVLCNGAGKETLQCGRCRK